MNPAHHSLEILIIEDHASTNEVLVKMLAKVGHVCAAVSDAAAAMEAFGRQRFDVVISDIGLPGTNGWDLLKRLRAMRQDFRAIALTGYCYPDDLMHSQEAGFDLHIAKPAEWGTIQDALSRLVCPAVTMRSGGAAP
jgi:two-component system, sensor histidine kinase